MTDKRRYKFDEARFHKGQQKAAILLVERQFFPKGERKTMQEIADEVGVTRKTLWNWDTGDQNFIEYKKYLSAKMMDSQVSLVYAKLIEAIEKRNSVKAIELYMKRLGDLADQQDITITDNRDADKSFDEKKAEILERLGEGKEGE